jgi:hypothetical protein
MVQATLEIQIVGIDCLLFCFTLLKATIRRFTLAIPFEHFQPRSQSAHEPRYRDPFYCASLPKHKTSVPGNSLSDHTE